MLIHLIMATEGRESMLRWRGIWLCTLGRHGGMGAMFLSREGVAENSAEDV